MQLENFVQALAVACSILTVSVSTAHARIRCDHEYQVNSGQRIVTPYCEDEYLAQVARSLGSRVSANTLRNNLQAKEHTCRFAGGDIRVKSICDGYRYDRDTR